MKDGAAIQRDLSRLQVRAGRNLTKFSKDKCKVLDTGRTKPVHWSIPGHRSALHNLVDGRLNMNQQHGVTALSASSTLGCRATSSLREGVNAFNLALTAHHLEGIFCLLLQLIQLWYKTHVDKLDHIQWRATTRKAGTGTDILLR